MIFDNSGFTIIMYMKIVCCNIRGLNDLNKRDIVKKKLEIGSQQFYFYRRLKFSNVLICLFGNVEVISM